MSAHSPSNRHKRQRLDDLQSYRRQVSPPPLPPNQHLSVDPLRDPTDPLRDYFREPESVEGRTQANAIDLTKSNDEGDIVGAGFSEGGPDSPPLNKSVPSPFKLTTIHDLPASENVGSVGIQEILGDVMLQEVWIFNYMHNIPWVMSQFDPDIRYSVKVYFVHGNWKREDVSKMMMEEDAKAYPNVNLVAAYMPEAFGTHHSKVMVLFRRDDSAQVVVHTANMIPFDWTNMTQAAWISPLLPLVSTSTHSSIGEAFKADILSYFSFYGKSRTGPLVEGLRKYCFGDVKAIFVGSVPGRHKLSESKFGWPKLKKVLSNIPSASNPSGRSNIVAQMSSIATLGVKDTWLTPVFRSVVSTSSAANQLNPEFWIVFPTAQEIRDSLNGYGSGSAIHIRLASAAQQKQLLYLKPLFHHWGSPPPNHASSSISQRSAGRDRAAPHIKTYIRFTDDGASPDIDWALLTSGNLSTQAWGAAAKDGTVRVCSYEAGVLVHPGIWGGGMKMKPIFKTNAPDDKEGVIGLRMPYSLPVTKYDENDEVWNNAGSYVEKDWLGQSHGETN